LILYIINDAVSRASSVIHAPVTAVTAAHLNTAYTLVLSDIVP